MPVPQNITADIYHKFPNYWILNGSGYHVQIGRPDLSTVLEGRCAASGYPAGRKQIREIIAWIAENQSIDYVLPNLPGYAVGLHLINKSKILVPEALTLIQPASGNADLCEAILLQMLGMEQLSFFFAWLAIGFRCLKDHECRPGQVLILAGPQGCGKNLVQEQIITPIFGGRYAEPYRYAVGKTQFNLDHYRAMHLMISDQKNPADRADMQEYIRRIASNDADSVHPKNKEAIGLEVLWRMSISCNEQEPDLRIIPPLVGLEDKILLFKCELHPMPMPTATVAERKLFRDAIGAELPALLDHVLSFKIQPHLHHERFGVRGYIHPDLARMVRELDPEEELLELVRDCRKAVPQMVLHDVTAGELHEKIDERHNLRPQLLSIAKSPHRLGRLLAKLADRKDGTVIKGAVAGGYQQWTINV
jgi:hypothetical protein